MLYKECLHSMYFDMRWICIYCDRIMDHTNFTEFIKQSDNDQNSTREAKVLYHSWRLMED
jgi:hypothetical protein